MRPLRPSRSYPSARPCCPQECKAPSGSRPVLPFLPEWSHASMFSEGVASRRWSTLTHALFLQRWSICSPGGIDPRNASHAARWAPVFLLTPPAHTWIEPYPHRSIEYAHTWQPCSLGLDAFETVTATMRGSSRVKIGWVMFGSHPVGPHPRTVSAVAGAFVL